jgi:hypothetical protein
MTREQDFERRLADWLADGPSSAPIEVVDRALERTEGRRQRHGAWLRLVLSLERVGHRFPTRRAARVATLAAVLAGVLLASAVITLPFGGGPASPPVMDSNAVVAIDGTVEMDGTSETPTQLTRVVDIESDDQRIEGQAIQELTVLIQSPDAHVLHGTMRLENDWGAWMGNVDIVTYPSGAESEYAVLEGTGTYEGFTYHHTIHGQPAGTVRAFEGAIWPDEPPAIPDPSLLP